MAISGRKPKDPENKIGLPVRTLVTIGVMAKLMEMQEKHGIQKPIRGRVSVDFLRLALYRLMVAEGVFRENPELVNDPTWDSLKQAGLV